MLQKKHTLVGTSTSYATTDVIHVCDAEMKASLPEIEIEELRDSDENIMFYTMFCTV